MKKINAVLFDLDGTLLPMQTEVFTKAYFGGLARRAAPLGYAPDRLVDAIWRGTGAMMKNDGSVTNETRFWQVFNSCFPELPECDRAIFDEFYAVDFPGLSYSCGHESRAAGLVRSLKERGLRVALATNPIFPRTATESRIRWAGLSPDDFEYISSFENSCHAKPNPDYFRDVLRELGLSPDECLMVGNDVDEDMVAQTLGMSVFLLTDCLINRKNTDVSVYPHGDFAALERFLDGI